MVENYYFIEEGYSFNYGKMNYMKISPTLVLLYYLLHCVFSLLCRIIHKIDEQCRKNKIMFIY